MGITVEEHLHPAILRMYGQARVEHRTADFAHVWFKNLKTAASWASTPEMARRCRLRDGQMSFDSPVVVILDLRQA